MKPIRWVVFILGFMLLQQGVWGLAAYKSLGAIIPLLIGASLVYLGWAGNRTALLVFGHATIAVGCFLVTWGIYLLPSSQPTLIHILVRPLFWFLTSIMMVFVLITMDSAPVSEGNSLA
ncbi:MAG: hypothetical protein PHU81_02065 [Acidobacteriota bacterium]|nr:hypothetical protein [Acidobacteriota bacterium]